MALFHIFADDPSRAKELATDEERLRHSIRNYLESFPKKKAAVGNFGPDSITVLKKELATELALIVEQEKDEEEIVNDLKHLKYSADRDAFHKLSYAMNHASSQEQFVYNLIIQLHHLLIDEGHTVSALEKNPGNSHLLARLKEQVSLEEEMHNQMPKHDLHVFYRNLALCERHKLAIEKHKMHYADQVYELMMDINADEWGKNHALSNDHISKLSAECYNEIEQATADAVADGLINPHDMGTESFEFVNSPLLERFIREKVHAHKFTDIDESTLLRFLHIFRDVYNCNIERVMQ